jgi:hypothetical protein
MACLDMRIICPTEQCSRSYVIGYKAAVTNIPLLQSTLKVRPSHVIAIVVVKGLTTGW